MTLLATSPRRWTMKSLASFGAWMVVGLSFAACSTAGSGGDRDQDDGEAVTAVNLETGETEEYDSEDDVPPGWIVCEEPSDCPDPFACGDVGEAACLERADCAPIYDEAGSFAGCGEGGTTCDAEACGPAPGMPAQECPDGSIGGNTGRCLAGEDGTCSWEIRECPEEEACAPEDCGPMPGMPAHECEDGSIGGNTGRCIRYDEICGWENRVCPEDQPEEEPCAPADCALIPSLPPHECDDGSMGGHTGQCIRYEEACGWEIRECPEDGG
jgi:hypothetical protein